MKKLISILLTLVMILTCLCLANSCNINGDSSDSSSFSDKASDSNDTENADEESEFEVTAPSLENLAIIHMIQEIDELPDWQAGKTEFNAHYYIDDMMSILDSLEWRRGDIANLAGDFDFRIDLYRKRSELGSFDEFFNKNTGESNDKETSAVTEADTLSGDGDIPDDDDRKISVQYLISYKDRVVNMRVSDESSLKFDIFAEIGEAEMKMIVLCLKYYFGPLK